MYRLRVLVAVAAIGVAVGVTGPALAGQGAVQAPALKPLLPANFVPPLRGEVAVGYTKPETKRDKDMIVTKIEVKNLAAGPIARLQIEEFWYDKAGNPLSGGKGDIKGMLKPGETATVTIETPYNKGMDRNNYAFSHANGTVKPTLLKSLNDADAPAKK